MNFHAIFIYGRFPRQHFGKKLLAVATFRHAVMTNRSTASTRTNQAPHLPGSLVFHFVVSNSPFTRCCWAPRPITVSACSPAVTLDFALPSRQQHVLHFMNVMFTCATQSGWRSAGHLMGQSCVSEDKEANQSSIYAAMYDVQQAIPYSPRLGALGSAFRLKRGLPVSPRNHLYVA